MVLHFVTMSESDIKEKDVSVTPQPYASSSHNDEEVGIVHKGAPLKTDLRGRHMQMIAVGMTTHSKRKHGFFWIY